MKNIEKIAQEILATLPKQVNSYETMVRYLREHGFKASEIEPKQEVERKIKLHRNSWYGYAESQINMKYEPKV